MEIDITKLQNNSDSIEIEENVSFSSEQLEKAGIISLDDCLVKGFLSKNNLDEYIIDVEVKGTMVLPCSVSLKPVNYKFNTKISGNVYEMLIEIDENYKKTEKTIDILPIIWENVLMEIPLKIVADDLSDIKTKGDGWELLTGDKKNINPELAKLKDLL